MTRSRKESSSSPMAGIFTRSRAEIFLHRTRSGHARPDPSRRKRRHLLLTSPTPPAADTPSIKDLRARRVFSNAVVPADRSPEKPGKIDPQIDPIDEPARLEEPLQMDLALEIIVDAPPAGSEVQAEEEPVQTTPPDLDLRNRAAPEASQRPDQRPDLGSISIYNPSKNRQGMTPCSRSKLYRNPSSFQAVKIEKHAEENPLSLKADTLTKDKDLAVVSEDHQDVGSKRDLDIVECTIPQAPPKEVIGDLTAIESTVAMSEREIDSTENAVSGFQNCGSLKGISDDQRAVESLNAMSNEKIGSAENSVPENSKPSLSVVGCQSAVESLDFSRESLLNIHKISSDTSENSDLEFKLPSYCHTVNFGGSLSVEELVGDALPEPLSKPVEEGIDRKIPSTLPLLGYSGTVGNCSLAPKRGILKRHTRGCKDLCLCLDCPSFPLHAERAHEFLRKKLLEADEVELGLTNELLRLRSLVEKSITPDNSATINHRILQQNQEQLNVACQRALKAEELAKSRLKQMIHELHVHCRVPGQRVTFAESMEQK